MREVKDVLEGTGENEDWDDEIDEILQEKTTLSPSELVVVGKVLTLIKACDVLFKKVARVLEHSKEDELVKQLASLSLACDEQNEFVLMDQMPQTCAEISEHVDDLACLLESPLSVRDIGDACNELSIAMEQLVDLATSVSAEGDNEWFDLMRRQVTQIVEGLQVER